MVKKLRDIGVYVYFETYNIDTKDETVMLILTIAAAIAEEELRNISANIKWAVDNTHKQGKAWGNPSIYGYKGKSNKELEQTEFEIIPEQAIIVQKIYRDYLAGNTIRNIVQDLTEREIPTPQGKEIWQDTTVKSILENEKYAGDLALQKTYKADALSTRRIKNIGKRDMFLVENNHLPIIDKATWQQVQVELASRERTATIDGTGRYSSKYAFSTKLECSECGTKYRRHTQWYKDNRVPVWVCSLHQKQKDKCGQMSIKETAIEDGFVQALSNAQANKQEYIAKVRADIESVISGTSHLNTGDLQAKLESVQLELLEHNTKYKGGRAKITQEAIDEATRLMDEINSLNTQLKLCKEAEDERCLLDYRLKMIDTALNMTFTKFNEELFKALIDRIIVLDKKNLRFIFKSGIEIEQAIA